MRDHVSLKENNTDLAIHACINLLYRMMQVVRNTNVSLFAFDLTFGLVTNLVRAQEKAAFQACNTWLVEQFCGAPTEGPKARQGTMRAATRLKENPDDVEIIDYVTHYYDNVPAGQTGYWPSLPGVVWVVCKYWDKITISKLDHLKTKLKGLSNLASHGSENHALVQSVAGYSFSQNWPDDTGWLNGRCTSRELKAVTVRNLMAVMRGLYDKCYNENSFGSNIQFNNNNPRNGKYSVEYDKINIFIFSNLLAGRLFGDSKR